jgi:protein-tyrosine phosphatase
MVVLYSLVSRSYGGGGGGMIDIHSHILFGIDDGAQTGEETLKMAKQATANGIRTMAATPHHMNNKYDNPPDRIHKALQDVRRLLEEHQIPLAVVPGMEIRAYGDLVADLQSGQLTTYNDKQRHILLELPADHVPRYITKLIFDIQVAGCIPIIAHPERNRALSEDPNILYRLVQKGALAQLTAASVAGKFGKKIQKVSHDMIAHHLIHFIATDAHNDSSRGILLQESYDVIAKRFGTDYVDYYQECAQHIVAGTDCDAVIPDKVKKKWFGLFG